MPTLRRRYAVLALCPLTLMLSGCGLLNLQSLLTQGGSSSASSTSSIAIATATGSTLYTSNFSFAGVPASTGALPSPVSGFIGAVANNGSAFTATFRLVTSNACVDPAQDITFTGTSGSNGITLTSTNLAANPISITWLDDPNQSSNGVGTYTITGSGPCAMAATNFVSDQYSPVTGTYKGSPTGNGVVASVTAVLTQGAANADGQFPETGTVTLATPSCTNTFTLTGTVTGPTLTAVFNQSGSTTLGGFVATVPDHALTLTFPAGLTVLGSCNGGIFYGGLSQ